MARNESDREDLLREATALVERIELIANAIGSANDPIGRMGEPVVAGFRANGAMSVFFGADPVYQFNAAGELRRAYCRGLLFKASRGRLISLSRERRANEVQLVSRELTDVEQGDLLRNMEDRLHGLRDRLNSSQYTVVGQVPADAAVLGRVRTWLADHNSFPIASSPRV
jgi:hypothetical protein